MEAGTLNCPGCGAPVTADSPQCPYCHALLKTVACTRCMSMMFLGTQFCPHCGAPAQTLKTKQESPRSCPACNEAMTEVEIGAETADRCVQCGGLWLGVDVFDRICSKAQAEAAASGIAPVSRVAPDGHVQYLNCPECGQPMGRINYAHRSGIVTNVCRAHGVWLERDQLRQIIDFIRSGGLDHARKIEQEQLEAAKRKLEFDRYMRENEGPSEGGLKW